MNNKGKYRVLAVSDLQIPFEHRDSIAFLKWVKAKYSPDAIVNVGDEVDCHALSDYDHDPDGYSAGHEMKRALEKLEEYYALFPNTMVCTSNHTARPLRKAFKAGIPKIFLKDYREFLNAPKGWEWKDKWEIDGCRYEHGEGASGPLGAVRLAISHGMPTIIGHLHSEAGIQFWANDKKVIYGFNVGCLINKKAYAFAYGRKLVKKPILGVGIIDKSIPTYIPMLLSSNGRWIGAK